MEELINLLSGNTALIIYILLFVFLSICGVGIPIPEDIPLLTAGYLAYDGEIMLYPAIIVCYLAIIAGDTVIFFMGRIWGTDIINHRFFSKILSPHRLKRSEEFFEKHGKKAIFFGRFVTGIRSATFFVAGASKVKYSRFILLDGIGALLSIPLIIYLGYYFGYDLETAAHYLDRIETYVLIAVLIIIAIIVYKYRSRFFIRHGK